MTSLSEPGVTIIDSRENRTVEYKSAVVEKYLEVADAFANYGDGRIVFGVSDDGTVVGLEGDLGESCLAIENAMNDAISPRPRFTITPDDALRTITLNVFQGEAKPYLYRNWAFRRSDTSTVRVDREEMRRLYLEGSNQSFDALPAGHQEISLTMFDGQLREKLGIDEIGRDVYRSLGLCTRDGLFTNAAALLADENDFPGVDVVRFGRNRNVMHERRRYAGVSVLEQIEGPLEVFRTNYLVERITGARRKPEELVPGFAFREALANAVTHRYWDVEADVMVYMDTEAIEVVSPGSLPASMSIDDYLHERITECRNRTLAYVLFRLGYVELLGTGVQRIIDAYEGQTVSPTFRVSESRISITLPVIPQVDDRPLSETQEVVLGSFTGNITLARREVEALTSLSQHVVARALRELESRGLIERVGNGRATRFRLRHPG